MNSIIEPLKISVGLWIRPFAVWLLVIASMGMAFEHVDEVKGITPEYGGLIPNSGKGDPKNSAGPSFSLSRENRFFRFSNRRMFNGPTTLPMSAANEPGPTDSPSLVIPDEGGVVHITRPTVMDKSIDSRLGNDSNSQDAIDMPKEVDLVRRHPIPEEGGIVHVSRPEFVERRLKKRKGLEEIVSTTTGTTKDHIAGNLPENSNSRESLGSGKFNEVSRGTAAGNRGLADITERIHERKGSENLTESSTEATAAITAAKMVTSIYSGISDYPFFAAVHSKRSEASFDDVVCSGGIVNKDVVVTSCSCICAGERHIPTYMSHYISVGHKKFVNIDNTPVYQVQTVKHHPSCDKTSDGLWLGDISMLMIAAPGIQFGKTVQPMNLPKLGMWEASDVLAKMSDERRHCRVIGWSRTASLIDTAMGKLIPLDECANPVCQKGFPCPHRSTVNGFMVEIIPNEPSLLAGSLLYCSEHVFAIVNTKRQCTTNNIFSTCSPEELLYSKFNFTLTDEAREELGEYNNSFSKSIDGWETDHYTEKATKTTPVVNQYRTNQVFNEIVSSGAIQLPFHVPREASWIYTYVFAAGYYVLVFN